MTAPKEMFLPANRNEWTSLVRPPEGYRLDCAIGTSFGLDFTALTALLLAMLDQPPGKAAWERHARRLQAITSLGDRVRVLVNRGQIHADIRKSNRVFALLDRIVDDVCIEGVAFHPKVWVLKYVPRRPVNLEASPPRKARTASNDAIYRLLCTSRNLTLYSSWEAVARLDGQSASQGEGKHEDETTATGRAIAAFIARVTKQTGPLSSPLRALLRELPRVAFSSEGSKAIKSFEFLWQWPGERPLMESIEPDGRTALLVSPFVRATFLTKLAARFKTLFVVSRQDELDGLWNPSIEKIIPRSNVWVVKPDAAEEDSTEEVPKTDAAEDDSTEGTAAQSLELHAKLLFCEYRRGGGTTRTETWLGSANASPRGWGSAGRMKSMNCEAMIRFAPGIRPNQFLEQFAYRPARSDAEKENPAMNGWIEPYVPRPLEPESEEEAVDRTLDAAREAFSSLALAARFERIEEVIVFVLRACDPTACRTTLSQYPEIKFEAAPLGIAETNARMADLAVLSEVDLRFENLSIIETGTFLLVRLTHHLSSRQKTFVVQIDIDLEEDFWSERLAAFLRASLSANEFRLFLRSILFDGVADPKPPGDGGDERGLPGGKPDRNLLDDMSVEDILRSCTQDRSRIDEVDRLLKMFEGTEHVDAPFRTFWDNFRNAVRAVEKGDARE